MVKYFSDSNIVKNRVKRSRFLNKLTPYIVNEEPYFYSYKIINGKVLYDQKNIDVITKLLEWLKEELWIKRDLSPQNKEHFFKYP